jgi:cytochrome P450
MTATAIAPGPKPSLFEAFSYDPGAIRWRSSPTSRGPTATSSLTGSAASGCSSSTSRSTSRTSSSPTTATSPKAGAAAHQALLGEGLLTSEGATHLRQRRLMQPAFHRDRIAAYADTMVAYADRLRGAWRDGATLDVAQEMNRLTLSIVGKTLFDADVESQAAEVGEALTGVMERSG